MNDTEFIGRVEQALPQALMGAGALFESAKYLACAPGAKRARPLISLRVAELCPIEPQVLVDIAVAVELMHSASLLHDDIIDSGQTRRGKPTLNVLAGNTAAVLTGDLVLSRALALLSAHHLTERAVTVVEEMTVAAFAEVNARGVATFPIEQWRRMAEGKSGALFGLSGARVALAAGEGKLAEQLDTMGRHLGVAFQIADDLDDLQGDASEGNPSFPLLLQAQGATPQEALITSQQAITHEIDSARLALGAAATHPALAEVWSWAEAFADKVMRTKQ